MIQRSLKDRRVGFGRADASRYVNGIEEVIESASPQHVIQPRVEVGDDAQFLSPSFQFRQSRRDVVINAPEFMTAKPLEDFVEEFFEARKQAEAVEDRSHYIAPPAFLKLDQRRFRRPDRKSQRRLSPKRSLEVSLHDSGLGFKAEPARHAAVDFADAVASLDQRSHGVEKDDLHLAYWHSELSAL